MKCPCFHVRACRRPYVPARKVFGEPLWRSFVVSFVVWPRRLWNGPSCCAGQPSFVESTILSIYCDSPPPPLRVQLSSSRIGVKLIYLLWVLIRVLSFWSSTLVCLNIFLSVFFPSSGTTLNIAILCCSTDDALGMTALFCGFFFSFSALLLRPGQNSFM